MRRIIWATNILKIIACIILVVVVIDLIKFTHAAIESASSAVVTKIEQEVNDLLNVPTNY